jgi:hypothetical protein
LRRARMLTNVSNESTLQKEEPLPEQIKLWAPEDSEEMGVR